MHCDTLRRPRHTASRLRERAAAAGWRARGDTRRTTSGTVQGLGCLCARMTANLRTGIADGIALGRHRLQVVRQRC